MKMRKQFFIDCDVNGQVITVQSNVNFITIDLDGTIRIWANRPVMVEDKWTSDNEVGFIIDKVELESFDTWHYVFDVLHNKFVEHNQCTD